MKIILLNGPPRSGKDTAAYAIMDNIPWATRIKFAWPLKNMTHQAYGLKGLHPDHFENVKDEPLEEFLGVSPRQAYIGFSERYMKPMHGSDIYGRLAVKDMEILPSNSVVAVPDSGFAEETVPVIEKYGSDNILLIRVHRDGTDFNNDSRSYLELDVETKDILNHEGEQAKYNEDVLKAVQEWLSYANV